MALWLYFPQVDVEHLNLLYLPEVAIVHDEYEAEWHSYEDHVECLECEDVFKLLATFHILYVQGDESD